MLPSNTAGGGCRRRPKEGGSSLTTVVGYIKESPSDNREGSDEDDDDEDDNWLDYSQMRNAFSSGTFISRKKSRYNRVELQDHSKRKHVCYGRFPLTDPWWVVTVHIDRKNQTSGPILYSLRTDTDGILQHNLVPILLVTAARLCEKDPDDKITKFEEYVRRTGPKDRMTFEHLESVLLQFIRQFGRDSPEGSLFHSILKTDVVQLVLRAHNHPALLKFLCQLFPVNFTNCLLRPSRHLLSALEKAAAEEPWVFGFNKILFTRFHLCGVEASLKALEMSGFLENIPDTYKDALYIYEVLKQDAARDGHTFISFPALQCHWHLKALAYTITDWHAALVYLLDNNVTHEERFDSKRNIFLYSNWKSEVDIADGLQVVLERGFEAEQPIWNVDLRSPELQRLHGDSNQCSAALKMISSPITILSGKGGCGKTTVVTELIRHICLQNSAPLVPAESNSQTSQILVNGALVDVTGCGDDGSQKPLCNAENSIQNGPRAPATPKKSSTSSQSSQLTPECLSQLTDYVTASQQSPDGGHSRKSKESQLYNDLCTDLIKYLATSGDTALSDTVEGQKIILTAPTGKAAKLLGHKASMRSYTLHSIIFSYRAFVKAQMKKKQMQEAQQEMLEDGLASDQLEEDIRKSQEEGAAMSSEVADQSQASISSEAVDDDKWKFTDTEVLVVDECSLVSLRLFATLLNILVDNSQLRKIILLGDVRQLPSIEPGNFLQDVFSVFKDRGLSVELMTNHRSESELIVSNATRISRRQLPLFDHKRNFHFWNLEGSECADHNGNEIQRLLCSCPELHTHETSQFVSFRRAHCEAINELCCRHYNDHSIRKAEGPGSRRPFDFRVGDKICFKKNAQVMNHGIQLQRILPPAILGAFGIQPRPSRNKQKEGKMDASAAVEKVLGDGEAGAVPRSSGAEGSRVMNGADSSAYAIHKTDHRVRTEDLSQTDAVRQESPEMNADINGEHVGNSGGDAADISMGNVTGTGSQVSQQESCEDDESKKLKQGEVRLCNGEVFFIMHDETEIDPAGKQHRYLYLSDRDPVCPRVFCCTLSQLKRDCQMHHAWARTIHTYQGSESDTVVYFVGEPAAQTWKHVYTAITRGRKAVFILGKEGHFREAVWKSDRQRRSRLSKRLTSMLKEVDMQKLHACVRETNKEAKAALLTHPSPCTSSYTPAHLSTSEIFLTQPSSTAARSNMADAHVKLDLTDSFSDSNDSWVHNMSPLIASWCSPTKTNIGKMTTSTSGIETDESLECKPSPCDNRAGGSVPVLAAAPSGEERAHVAPLKRQPDGGATTSTAGEGPSPSQRKLSPKELSHDSPYKRQLSQKNTDATPTKRTRPDSIDSIISPVRKTLNI